MNTGGPAFPAHHFDMADNEHGMTLRDYFAAKAMQAVMSDPSLNRRSLSLAADVATAAYVMADAMLTERDKQ